MPRHSPYRIELTMSNAQHWSHSRAHIRCRLGSSPRSDGAARRPRVTQRLDRAAIELPPRGRLTVAYALLRGKAWPARGPTKAGRPATFLHRVRAEVIALACDLPVARGMPLSRWSSQEVAREVIARGIVEQISDVTVWRWLSVKTPSARGTIGLGSSRASPAVSGTRPARSSTSITGAGRANCYIPATSSWATTRSPRSKPEPASTRAEASQARRRRAARRARIRLGK